MRYIIDAAFLQAQLLNRTLVLPSFVYARGCEYELQACADYAPMVNKNDAIGWDQWRNLPHDQQMGWRLPLGLMLNVTRMRALHPVILVSDYLRLHGLPESAEASTAQWQRETYHANATARVFGASSDIEAFISPATATEPSLFVIENNWYDPHGVARVDALPDPMKQRGGWTPAGFDADTGRRGSWTRPVDTDIERHLSRYLVTDNPLMSLDAARRALRSTAAKDEYDIESDGGLERALNAHGYEIIYTYDSVRNMDLAKTVTEPIRQVVPRASIRAFRDEYIDRDEDVVLLAGETHNGRKAGALRFTSAAARDDFTRMVLHHIVPVDRVLALAEDLASRMSNLTEGRLWMGAHMRRGDFVLEGWVLMPSVEDHVNRVRMRLDGGRRQLETLENPHTYDVPDVELNPDLRTRSPPVPDDPFYVATDERSPAGLATIRAHGAVLLPDLLTTDDRRAFGWPLMLTDVRSVLEQELLAHSAYFYAHSKSSVSGGTVNMRAARGADPRTAWIE
ncbi:hypothetical protein OF83DRAFT_283845 [Amylostereum chailletii]|nr:hypothetical protein OF83DRAFT_283845 [Amylostereum chailletii]